MGQVYHLQVGWLHDRLACFKTGGPIWNRLGHESVHNIYEGGGGEQWNKDSKKNCALGVLVYQIHSHLSKVWEVNSPVVATAAVI